MDCPSCGSENGEESNYCGKCGESLAPATDDLRVLVERHVQQVLAGQFKDQSLVEIETTQAVANRLSNWAKLFGFFVGIPLALLAIVLSLLGINEYRDFVVMIDETQSAVNSNIEAIQGEIAEAEYYGRLEGIMVRLARVYEGLGELEGAGGR